MVEGIDPSEEDPVFSRKTWAARPPEPETVRAGIDSLLQPLAPAALRDMLLRWNASTSLENTRALSTRLSACLPKHVLQDFREREERQEDLAFRGIMNLDDAQRCLEDPVRTGFMVRAAIAGIRAARERHPDEMLVVCGAGCGPLPVLELAASAEENVLVYAIEGNDASAAAARELVRIVGAANVRVLEGDLLRMPLDFRPHIVMSETFDMGLWTEQAVKIFNRLRLRAASDVVMVPSAVRVRAAVVPYDGGPQKGWLQEDIWVPAFSHDLHQDRKGPDSCPKAIHATLSVPEKPGMYAVVTTTEMQSHGEAVRYPQCLPITAPKVVLRVCVEHPPAPHACIQFSYDPGEGDRSFSYRVPEGVRAVF